MALLRLVLFRCELSEMINGNDDENGKEEISQTSKCFI
jgi:hypothetical protein